MDSIAPHDRYFRIVFFIAAIALIVCVAVVLGAMPGRRARRRGHPRADSINTLAWVGLVCPPLWICAMWWASNRFMTRPHATLHVPVKPRDVARRYAKMTPFEHATSDDDDEREDEFVPRAH